MASALQELLIVMARLRDPECGCPWDLAQTFESIAPYTLEEAYEVEDAIQRKDWHGLKDELGDLLLQVVFHSRMAEERGLFGFDDVAQAIVDKLYRRHPHVFGNESSENLKETWEQAKAAERRAKAGGGAAGRLDDVPQALPALARARKLQSRAARVGFDWNAPEPAAAKITEELDEVRNVAQAAADDRAVAEEVGDLLFACVNYARHLGVDAEAALMAANRKFEARFRYMEAQAEVQGEALESHDLPALEALWQRAKRAERE